MIVKYKVRFDSDTAGICTLRLLFSMQPTEPTEVASIRDAVDLSLEVVDFSVLTGIYHLCISVQEILDENFGEESPFLLECKAKFEDFGTEVIFNTLEMAEDLIEEEKK